MEDWLIWLLAGVALGILEIVTPGFIFACFSFGCFGAAVAAALDFNLTAQIIVFSVVTLVVFVSARQIYVKLLGNRRPEARTNLERLIGSRGLVLEEVSSLQGAVKVEGEVWSSRSENGEVLSPGMPVRILRVEGNKLSQK
jgi:membrane protein implicated in regulation of membrane protease activity